MVVVRCTVHFVKRDLERKVFFEKNKFVYDVVAKFTVKLTYTMRILTIIHNKNFFARATGEMV